MRFKSLKTLVAQSLRRDRRGVASSVFGVVVGVGSLVFFLALGLGVGRVIRDKVFPVDLSLVEVVPPSLSLGAFLGGGKLDEAMVARLTKLDGVARAYKKMNVRIPAVSRYDGNFFGSRLRMGVEVLAVGVEPELVRQDVQLGEFRDAGQGQPIPALVSSRLLEIYNKTFAPARKLPQLGDAMVVGFSFPVLFNRSFVAAGTDAPSFESQVQVAGVSDRALLAGITIPLETAVRLNRQAGVDAESYSSVVLEAATPSKVTAIVEEVKKMGLSIDDQDRKLAENAGGAVALVTAALALLSALICLLAAVNIAHALSASVAARAREIGVMQAVGASRADIRNLVFGEAAAVGLLGGGIGTLLARVGAWAIDGLAVAYLPPFPFKPESFFAWPWPVLVGGLAVGVVASLMGAYWPARSAAAVDPARTLAG